MDVEAEKSQIDSDLSGIWKGWYEQENYYQDDDGGWQYGEHRFLIEAELVFAETMIVGQMWDETHRWVVPLTKNLRVEWWKLPWWDGLKQLAFQLRNPGSKWIVHLPEFSDLFGWVKDSEVTIHKTYRGSEWQGYFLGDKLVLYDEPSEGLVRIYTGFLDLSLMQIRGTYNAENPEVAKVSGSFMLERVSALEAGVAESHMGPDWK